MNTAIIISVVGLIQAVAVAVIGGMFTHESKRHKKEQANLEKRADIRAQEGLLSMEMINANTDLAFATAIAVRDDKCNGEMEMAMVGAKAAQRKYYNFINKIATDQIAEN